MACFGGPIAPDSHAQWTKAQNQLVYPMVSAMGQGLFGEEFKISELGNKIPKGYQYPGIDQMRDPFAYAGKFSAGPSDLQNQYFGAAPQVAQQQLGQLGQIGSGQTQMNFANRFAQDVITPQVMERFAGMGTENSGGAMKGLTRELGNYGLNAMSQAVPQQMQALNQMSGAMGGLGAAGAEQQNLAQQQLLGAFQEKQAQNPFNSPTMQQAMNILGFRTTPQAQPAGMGYSALAGLIGNPAVQGAAGMGLNAAGSALSGIGSAVGSGASAVGSGLSSLMSALGSLSDERLKENIVPIENCLAKIQALTTYTYNFKGTDESRVGLIAQEVEKVLPEAVIEVDGYKAVDLYAILSLLVGAVRELTEKRGAA